MHECQMKSKILEAGQYVSIGGIHKHSFVENFEIFAKRYSLTCIFLPAVDF
jgi:hypothetical protein